MSGHFSTSIAYIRRSPFQALAAIFTLMVTFFVTTLLAILVYSSNQVLSYFETRPQIIVFLKDDANEVDVEALRAKLSADSRIKSLNLVTKEQALEIYKKATVNNPLLGELVSPSIFPASLEFSVTDLDFTKAVIEEIKSEKIVDTISFTANIGDESKVGDVVEKLKTITYYIRLGGVVAVSILAFTSFLVLTVVISMRITIKRDEIESLSLIGATNSFIRMPIVLEALAYAVLGVTAGWLLGSVLMMYATPSILSYFGDVPVLPRNTLSFFGMLGAIWVGEVVVGIIIALLGSLGAVGRSLRVVK